MTDPAGPTDAALEALSRYQREHGALTEDAGEGMWAIDAHGRTVWIGPGMAEMLDHPRRELLGRSVFDFMDSQNRPVVVAELERRRLGLQGDYPGRFRRRDGSEVRVRISATPLFDDAGDVVGSLARFVDVTGRLADRDRGIDVEERLRAAEERFRRLLDGIPDAVIGVHPDGRIVLANARVQRLSGYRPDELVGRRWLTLAPERLRDEYADRHRRYFAGEHVPVDERQLIIAARGGTEVAWELSISRLELDGETIAAVVVRDVDARRRLEQGRSRLESRLRQFERLESLGQLAGGVAHDFNNLLAVIRNYAAVARSGLDRGHPVQADLQEIERAADRAAGLTRQLLVFSRREPARLRPLDVNSVVHDTERLLRRTLGEHIEVRTVLAPDLWRVLGDPGQVEQVLMNLAINARDAMRDGGVLSMLTANVCLDASNADLHPGAASGSYVQLTVSDTGAGMSEEIRARAFEPFFTTKPKGAGTGLGLATVHGAVQQMGGHVRLRSAPDRGTVFALLLPAAEDVTPLNPR